MCSASRKDVGAKVLQEIYKAAPRGTVICKKNQWARRDGVTEQQQWNKEEKSKAGYLKLVEMIINSVIVWKALIVILYTELSKVR